MAILNLYPLPRDPAQSYLDRLSPRSRPTMRSSLRTLARLLGAAGPDEVAWEELRYSDTSLLRNGIVEAYAASTARRHLVALRGVLKQCWRLQLISHEDLARASDLEPPPRLDAEPWWWLQVDEIRALFAACRDGGKTGPRDLALLQGSIGI